jgi:hypothetical protein
MKNILGFLSLAILWDDESLDSLPQDFNPRWCFLNEKAIRITMNIGCNSCFSRASLTGL